MKKAAAYIRVSTDRQTELSPESQLNEIRAFAKRNDMILLEDRIYRDDGISGTSIKRRNAFLDMMKQRLGNIKDKFPLRVLGPARSGQGRINNRYKYVLTLKCRNSKVFRSFVSELLIAASKDKKFSNVRVYADINGDIN